MGNDHFLHGPAATTPSGLIFTTECKTPCAIHAEPQASGTNTARPSKALDAQPTSGATRHAIAPKVMRTASMPKTPT